MTGKPAGARPNRTGDPWQRKSDGRWCARVWPADGSTGKPRYVYGTTREQVTAKLAVITAADGALEAGKAVVAKPVRVTLNIPPELYRQLRRWTGTAADEIGAPQVSQQDALRAMIEVTTRDKSIGIVTIDWLRHHP